MSNPNKNNNHAPNKNNAYRNIQKNNQRRNDSGKKQNDSDSNKKTSIVTVFNEDVYQESQKYRQEQSEKTDVTDEKKESVPNVDINTNSSNGVELANKDIDSVSSTTDVEKKEGILSKETDDAQKTEQDSVQAETTLPVSDAEKNAEKVSVEDTNKAASAPQREARKDRRPSTIDLKNKSEAFKKIIDVALAYGKLEEDSKNLRSQVSLQAKEIIDLKETINGLEGNLKATELLCMKKQADIDQLKSDIEHRNEVIDIVKADKKESSQEFKNALAAALRTYMQDFKELRELEMSDDVGCALVETMEGVFKVLAKNGITV